MCGPRPSRQDELDDAFDFMKHLPNKRAKIQAERAKLTRGHSEFWRQAASDAQDGALCLCATP